VYILKLKIKQSIYIVDKGNIETGQEIEIKNKAQAKSLIQAGYAEEVVEDKKPSVEETPEVEVEKVEEKPKTTRGRKKAKDGE
jgi:hypothetical protein